MSSKTRKIVRYETQLLDVYRKLHWRCENCGRKQATDIHELFSAGRRHVARQHRSCILHLCRTCHEKLQHAPKALQLAIKLVSDPQGFDLLEFNRLYPGMPVSMKDIDEYLPIF